MKGKITTLALAMALLLAGSATAQVKTGSFKKNHQKEQISATDRIHGPKRLQAPPLMNNNKGIETTLAEVFPEAAEWKALGTKCSTKTAKRWAMPFTAPLQATASMAMPPKPMC